MINWFTFSKHEVWCGVC